MSRKLVLGSSLTKEKFAKPPSDYGIFPFWFWNGNLDKGKMLEQMREFKNAGMPGFFIHSRYGNEIPYLSKEWFDRVNMVCAEAETMGLETWIYDEHNWPSGTVGLRIPKEHPDLQQRYLEMVVVHIDGPLFMFLEGIDSRYIDMRDSEPVAAFAVRTEEYSSEIKEVIDLMPNLTFDKVISWEVPEGKWELLYFIERRIDWYPDVFDPKTTELFINLTHEKYKEHSSKYFGTVLNGFYTDEPTCLYFATGENNFVLPWSRHMLRYFKQRNGYNLRPLLPALYLNLGEKTSRVRLNFWQTVSEQYDRSFFGQIARWCHQNDLFFTGHLLYEDMLRMHARNEGNLFDHLKHLDIIGVDHLYPRVGNRSLPDQHVPHKIGSSAAHHFGVDRVLCESLGGSHWDATMSRMKWIADWEYVLGINLFNPHGFHYSISSERKRDWPPSQFYHHTWWKYYNLFNDYIARHSYMLSGGRHIAKIAVLYPINSMWANFTPQGHSPISEAIENDFNYLADTLLRLHFDFDYIDESVLANAQVKAGTLQVARENFEVIILSSVTNIRKDTLAKLEEFVAAGGKVIASVLLPSEDLDGSSLSIAKRVENLFGLDPLMVKSRFLQGNDNKTVVHQHPDESVGTFFIESPGLAKLTNSEILDSTIRRCISPDVEVDCLEIFYLHREKDGQHIYFFVNPTHKEQQAQVRITGEGILEEWNGLTGKVHPVFGYRVDGGSTYLSLTLEPVGSRMLVLRPGVNHNMISAANCVVESATDESVVVMARGVESVDLEVETLGKKRAISFASKKDLAPIELDDEWQFSAEPYNALLITNWKTAIDQDGVCEEEGFVENSFDDSQWMDFRYGIWEMQLDEEFAGTYPLTLWYRARFDCDHLPKDARILIDGIKGDYSFFLNGAALKGELNDSSLDAMIKELPIASALIEGENVLVIRLIVSAKTDGIVDPLKIIGSFSLNGDDEKRRIQPPRTRIVNGSWTEQGYPFFSGTGVYRQIVNIPEQYLEGKVYLSLDCGEDVLEVFVNNEQAGICLWRPYRLEIGEYLKPGENEITIHVTNTLVNLLEGVTKPSGIFGKVTLIPYNTYKVRI